MFEPKDFFPEEPKLKKCLSQFFIRTFCEYQNRMREDGERKRENSI